MRDDRERLLDILEAINKIEKYACRGWEVFARDELIQSWIINQLRIIGEAARTLSENTRKRFPQVPWRKIIGMRHILVHQYLEVDPALVWQVVVYFFPQLKGEIQTGLTELEID